MSINTVSSYSLNTAIYNYNSGKITPVGSNNSDSEDSEKNSEKTQELAKDDREVRAHEQAHLSVGGRYIKGVAHYQYQKGTDGKMYAVSGEVSIDVSPVNGNPQATIAKMATVRSAALAPADPSGQDRAVAASATAEEIKARQELTEESSSSGDTETTTTGFSGTSGSQKTSTYNQKGIGTTSSDSANSGSLLATA
jgi:ribosomal protein L12E/L44/L45/RPP1/RPP2